MATGELIGWESSQGPCVHPSVRPFTLSNMNISETSRLSQIKFHLEHQWGGGRLHEVLRPDLIRTLIYMATDSFHRLIMRKIF